MNARLRLVAALALGAACLIPAVAHGGSYQPITVEAGGNDVFSPDQLVGNVNSDHRFQWSWGAGTTTAHNVRQDSKLFYSGEPSDTNPPFSVSASAGRYHYYCEVHGSKAGGMDGEVAVRPKLGSPKGKQGVEYVFVVQWATEDAQTGNQFDVQYKVGSGDWKFWKKNTSKLEGLFGGNGKPVTVKDGKTYRVRARTEKASNPDKRSGWSPPLIFGIT
jgi:plastocyanin